MGGLTALGTEAKKKQVFVYDVRGAGLFVGIELYASSVSGDVGGGGFASSVMGDSGAIADLCSRAPRGPTGSLKLVPAKAEASVVCLKLLTGHRILSSLDGPQDNVLVLKPPMVFRKEDCDTFVAALRSVLRDTDWDTAVVGHTPT